ncbi:hypothetical protein CQW23_28371 [Capsicum baccatum]|uniref:Uncharacterized protein n=1 Tax=Capsicum baccatum TaxID=33114 RepID=A0A2G2VGC5_CAPBA|nr:hypothetical protein CQW23_28371 [Capsicum baccatum]
MVKNAQLNDINALRTELAQLRAYIEEQNIELLNSRKATALLVEDQGKVTENLQPEILVLRRALIASGQTHEGSSKVKIPEPKAFGGVRSATELENFLWDMEQYLPELLKQTS